MVVVPTMLVLVGFLILRWADGQWGIFLWILVSPPIYLLADMLVSGEVRRAMTSKAKRPPSAVSGEPVVRREPVKKPPPSDWASARTVSTGAEILRRGRRYDRRRA